MITTLISVLFALFGLSTVIFLHELGHLIAALWAGMKVEAFSIGFGRALWSWQRWGVEWRVGSIPLGGYVRVLGMGESHDSGPGSYNATAPWKRMVVVAMGPLVNFALAWALFAVIWAIGGQQRSFAELSRLVGYLDPDAKLAQQLEPGDRVIAYNGRPVRRAQDHLLTPLLAKGAVGLEFDKIDYADLKIERRHGCFETYLYPGSSSFKTLGILAPARWMQVQGIPEKAKQWPGSLAQESIRPGDQLVAVNGTRVWSDQQLRAVLNDRSVELTLVRQGELRNVRATTYALSELDLPEEDALEIGDWMHELGIAAQQCRWIGYTVTPEGVLKQPCSFPGDSSNRSLLQAGDRIVAVNGDRIDSIRQLLASLQQSKAVVYLYRQEQPVVIAAPLQAEQELIARLADPRLEELLQKPLSEPSEPIGPYLRLGPVLLPTQEQINPELLAAWRLQAAQSGDLAQRAQVLESIQHQAQQRVLGLQIGDRLVIDNPGPNEQFAAAFSQIWQTLGALFRRQLLPRAMAGPVGMVTMLAQSATTSGVEGLYWLGFISLNLAVFNLLPLPIFDGGRLLIEGFELLTGRKVNSRLVDLVAYFLVVALALLTLVLTYWDLGRLLPLW